MRRSADRVQSFARPLVVFAVVALLAAWSPDRAYQQLPGTDDAAAVIGLGPHLFIDDELIALLDGVTRELSPPVRMPAPAIALGDRPRVEGAVASAVDYVQPRTVEDELEAEAPALITPSVVWDPTRQRFRLWYAASGSRFKTRLVHRESDDGAHWSEPGRVVLAYNGFGSGVIDGGPSYPIPERRFKLAVYAQTPGVDGVHVAFSPDGLAWTPYAGNPVIKAGDSSDIIDPFWDPLRRQYGIFTKASSDSVGEPSLQSPSAPPGTGVRITRQTSSLNFLNWEDSWPVFTPEGADPGITEFYGAAVLARGDLLIAFPRILRDDLGADSADRLEGIGYTTLAVSRDGRTWRRMREPFLDRSPVPGQYDRAMAWIYGVAQSPAKAVFTYSAYELGHKRGSRQIGVAVAPRDRFVALSARGLGTLRTRLLLINPSDARGIRLNADGSRGEIRVQAVGADDLAVEGFSFADCAPLVGDSLDHPLTCRGEFSSLLAHPFRLHIRMRDSRLFGFSLAPL